ncbi:MAG: HlyD family efflux transporter periplasmic adaptor subunit [Salaquimonas sp.]
MSVKPMLNNQLDKAAGQAAEVGKVGTVVNLKSDPNKNSNQFQPEPFEKRATASSDLVPTLLEQILAIEGRMRKAETLQALRYYAVNELRQIIPASQIMILQRKSGRKAWAIKSVSSLAAPDERSPMLQWLSSTLGGLIDRAVKSQACLGRLELDSAPHNSPSYRYTLFYRFDIGASQRASTIVFFSDKPFSDQHKQILTRLGETFGHAWSVFDRGKPNPALALSKPVKFLIGLAVLLTLFIPVPLAVLAPARIVADKPTIVAAPINGVIEEIHVLPNQPVKTGDLLYSFDKTEAKNNLENATRNLGVSESRYRRASQAAFGSNALKGEVAIAKAEVELAAEEKASFVRRLGLADVHATASGIVLFESIDRWVGIPVETGERVMRIADPEALRIEIDLAGDDTIILDEGASAKLFLDANPLNPYDARIIETSYQPIKSERDTLVFQLRAELLPEENQNDLRIGLRGTAQLFGDPVPLWFFLFRKPLSYLRQLTGI